MAEETFPMTPAGLERLRVELKRIKEVERPDNVREIETAREHGDLRENAEYHAAKERQGNLEGRLRYLEYRIAHAEVIDPAAMAMKTDRIAFGATVTVLDVDTEDEIVYAIVGEDEADADQGRLSIFSPIVRALIGKVAGDAVTLHLPKGARELEVVRVEYKPL